MDDLNNCITEQYKILKNVEIISISTFAYDLKENIFSSLIKQKPVKHHSPLPILQ